MIFSNFWATARELIAHRNPRHRKTQADQQLALRDQRIAELEADNVELGRLIRTDPLTGLLNRRGGQEALEDFYSRCVSSCFVHADDTMNGTPFVEPRAIVVIAIDLDHFKTINDTYGHEVGDTALVKVADELQAMFRVPHEVVVVRQGGEEMYVAMMTKQTDALQVGLEAARWIGRSIAAHCHVADGAHHVTASLGIGYVIPDANAAIWIKDVGQSDRSGDRPIAGGFDRRRDAALHDLLHKVMPKDDRTLALEALPGFQAQRQKDLVILLKDADDCVYAAKTAGRNRAFWLDYRTGKPNASDLNEQPRLPRPPVLPGPQPTDPAP